MPMLQQSVATEIQVWVVSSSNLPRVVLTALVELKTKRTLYVLSVFHPVSLQNIVLEAFSDANVREHIRVGDVDR